MRVRRAALSVVILALMAVAAFHSVRLAYADVLFLVGDRESLRRAIDLDPGRALYHVALAIRLDELGEDPRPALHEAAALAPGEDRIWNRLGLAEESRGRYPAAERHLLRAAAVSRKYAPRWTLANFYYRRGDEESFWRWAREAFAMSHGDRTPLFDLCWSVSPDPQRIRELALPDDSRVQIAWTYFLLSRQQRHDAASVACELAGRAPKSFFLNTVDALLSAGAFTDARAVWDAAMAPAGTELLTNPQFRTPALNRAFGWRVSQNEGLFVAETPEAWRVTLTGAQPERCEVLAQLVPLTPGQTYRFRCRYQANAHGLRWRMQTPEGAAIAESGALSPGGAEESFEFQAPFGVSGGRLALVHERERGAMRAEGTITLENVSLTAGTQLQAQ